MADAGSMATGKWSDVALSLSGLRLIAVKCKGEVKKEREKKKRQPFFLKREKGTQPGWRYGNVGISRCNTRKHHGLNPTITKFNARIREGSSNR